LDILYIPGINGILSKSFPKPQFGGSRGKAKERKMTIGICQFLLHRRKMHVFLKTAISLLKIKYKL